jgi:hypothetical protein
MKTAQEQVAQYSKELRTLLKVDEGADLTQALKDLEGAIEQNQKNFGAPPIKVTKTDTLLVEFCPLPIQNTSYEFLYRFVEPIETVWTKGEMRVAKRLSVILPSSETRMKRFCLKEWMKLALDGTTPETYPESMKWLLELRKCELIECGIVRL